MSGYSTEQIQSLRDELATAQHNLASFERYAREAEEACGDYLKAPHDDLVGAIKDMRQEILLVRTALNRAAEEVERLRQELRGWPEAHGDVAVDLAGAAALRQRVDDPQSGSAVLRAALAKALDDLRLVEPSTIGPLWDAGWLACLDAIRQRVLADSEGQR